MVTDVDAVYTRLGHAGPERDPPRDARGAGRHASSPAGSMGPKVDAARRASSSRPESAPRSARSSTRPPSSGARPEPSSRATPTGSSSRPADEAHVNDDTTTSPEPEHKSAVHAAVGLHDPVRADRGRRDRDLDHPGRHVRLQRGRHAGSRHLPLGAGQPGAHRHRLARPRRSTACTASRPRTASIIYYNSGELFGAIDVALFILVIGGFLGVTMKTGAIQAGIARRRRAPDGPRASADPDPHGRSSRWAARPSAWPRRASPSTSW